VTVTASEKWAKVREGGRTRYVLVYGVCLWGVLTGSMMAAFLYVFRDESVLGSLSFIPAMMIAGIVYGRLTWQMAERRHGFSRQDTE
jgi:hypothetical protein